MTEEMPWTESTFQIPFYDVDSMGIVWHGRYVKYLELARCQLLDEIGYNYVEMRESGYAWPVVDLRLRYINPVRFQQRVKVRAELKESENRLKIDYLITDEQTGQRLTRGSTVQVAVEIESGELLLVCPPVLEDRLKAWQR